MADVFVLQVMLVLLAASLALLAITTRQPGWKKVVAIGLFCGLVATGYAFVTDLLGRPKPARLATIVQANEPVSVVSSHLVENKAIYLWVLRGDATEPMAFTLPWSIETAKKCVRARFKSILLFSICYIRHIGNIGKPWIYIPLLYRSCPKPKHFCIAFKPLFSL